MLFQSLDAWRLNPLALASWSLPPSTWSAAESPFHVAMLLLRASSINSGINHLNRMPIRVFELCDELDSLRQSVLWLLSTDESGMT
jgi:hypothetical protein